MQSKVTNRSSGERGYMTQCPACSSVGEGELRCLLRKWIFTLQEQTRRDFVDLGRFVLTQAKVILYGEGCINTQTYLQNLNEYLWLFLKQKAAIESKLVSLLCITTTGK